MLNTLGWKNLEARRRDSRLNLMYNITHNNTAVSAEELGMVVADGRTKANHHFFCHFCRTNLALSDISCVFWSFLSDTSSCGHIWLCRTYLAGTGLGQHFAHSIVGGLEHNAPVERPTVPDLVVFLQLSSLTCQLGTVLGQVLVHEDL